VLSLTQPPTLIGIEMSSSLWVTGVGLVSLIGAVVCLLVPNRWFNCFLMQYQLKTFIYFIV